MSYEPTLIIRKKDLFDNIKFLQEEEFSKDADISRVAKYLLKVSTYRPIKFDDLELLICSPELTSFNKQIRDRLTSLDIDFQEYF